MKKLVLVLTMLPMLAIGQTLDDCQQAAEKNYPLIQQYGLTGTGYVSERCNSVAQ